MRFSRDNESTGVKRGRLLYSAMLVFALLTLPLSLYTAGYLMLCSRINWSRHDVGYTDEMPPDLAVIERSYQSEWATTLFQPAGRIEQFLRGVEVRVSYTDRAMVYDGLGDGE